MSELRISIDGAGPILARFRCEYLPPRGRRSTNPIIRAKAIVSEIRRIRAVYQIPPTTILTAHIESKQIEPLDRVTLALIERLGGVTFATAMP